ncbi:MAG TPA: DUF2785 domain-containing protein [Ktedonobacterales bacterium]|nr:DUF2785 domain-containing protein [Ktedonobacterales bacterium]
MVERESLEKIVWHSIIDADYAVPEGQSATTLLPDLVAMLGSTDPVARDQYAYSVLATWIERGAYTHAELRTLGQTMTVNLQAGIGEAAGDRVFLRAFSVLILASVIEYDSLHPFLDEQEVRAWLEAGLRYLEQEQDLRGYVEGKGWAHSGAHTADLLAILAQNGSLEAADLERILNAIADKVRQRIIHVYLYDEDERLAYAVRKALHRNLLDISFLTDWLRRLIALDGLDSWGQAAMNTAAVSAYINIRDFARSLYFQLKLAPQPPTIAPALCAALEETLRALDLGFYS